MSNQEKKERKRISIELMESIKVSRGLVAVSGFQ